MELAYIYKAKSSINYRGVILTQINPLIFIFLGAIVSSISAMIIYLRGEIAYIVFLIIGIVSLAYGFLSRTQLHVKQKKARRESKRHIERIPKLKNQDLDNERLKKKHMLEAHKKMRHMEAEKIHQHAAQEQKVSHGKVLKHCSSCHTVWHENDLFCKKCHSRHFYYMSH